MEDYDFSDVDTFTHSVTEKNKTARGRYTTTWFSVHALLVLTFIVLALVEIFISLEKPFDPKKWSHNDYFYLTVGGAKVKFSLAPILICSVWLLTNMGALFCYGMWVLQKSNKNEHFSVLLGGMSAISSACLLIGLIFYKFKVHCTLDWNGITYETKSERYGSLSPNIQANCVIFGFFCFVISFIYMMFTMIGFRSYKSLGFGVDVKNQQSPELSQQFTRRRSSPIRSGDNSRIGSSFMKSNTNALKLGSPSLMKKNRSQSSPSRRTSSRSKSPIWRQQSSSSPGPRRHSSPLDKNKQTNEPTTLKLQRTSSRNK